MLEPHPASIQDRDGGAPLLRASRRGDVAFWPIATNFSLGPQVRFQGEADMNRPAELAGSVKNDPTATSASPPNRPL